MVANAYSAVFGSTSSHASLTGKGDGQVCEWIGEGNLLSDLFDSKQSGESGSAI